MSADTKITDEDVKSFLEENKVEFYTVQKILGTGIDVSEKDPERQTVLKMPVMTPNGQYLVLSFRGGFEPDFRPQWEKLEGPMTVVEFRRLTGS